MFCHWLTVLGMIILLAVAFSTGAITRSEQFSEMYETGIPKITA